MDAKTSDKSGGNPTMNTVARGGTYFDDGGLASRRLSAFRADCAVYSRGECKQRIAEMHRREERKAELRATLAAANAELDGAVAAHGGATAPLQIELRKIDEQQTDQIIAGGQLNAKSEKRRIDLRSQVDEHNCTLQEVSDRCRRKIELLETELDSPELDTSAANILHGMLLNEFADGRKRARLDALQSVQQIFEQPLKSISQSIVESREQIRQCEQRKHFEGAATYQKRLGCSELQASILGRCLSELRSEAAALLDEMGND
jgi:hypothetical protein